MNWGFPKPGRDTAVLKYRSECEPGWGAGMRSLPPPWTPGGCAGGAGSRAWGSGRGWRRGEGSLVRLGDSASPVPPPPFPQRWFPSGPRTHPRGSGFGPRQPPAAGVPWAAQSPPSEIPDRSESGSMDSTTNPRSRYPVGGQSESDPRS